MGQINDTVCKAISMFVDTNLIMPENYSEAVKNIDSLFNYLQKIGYVINTESAKVLLSQNNGIIKKSFDLFKEENKELDSLSKLVNNNSGVAFVNAYKELCQSKYKLDNLLELLLDSKNDFELFQRMIEKIPLLTLKEEKELGKKLLLKDTAAREEFIMRNVRLVLPFVDYFKDQGMSEFDIVQEGIVGLIHAVDKYDVTSNIRFYFYASPAICRNIQKSLSQKYKSIRIPYVLDLYLEKRDKIVEDLTVVLGRVPTEEEIEEKVGKKSFIEEAYKADNLISLEESVDDEDLLIDTIAINELTPEQRIVEGSLKEEVQKLLDKALTEREKNIVLLRLGYNGNKPMTLGQIAELYQLTDSRISEIYFSAMDKLIRYKDTSKLAFYANKPETAKENLMQKQWAISKDTLHFDKIDVLINVLRERLQDVNPDTLAEYYCPTYVTIISLFMGYNGFNYDAKRICRTLKINIKTLRSCLIDIYSIYDNQIKSDKLTRKKNEND